MTDEHSHAAELIELTADVVAAYVSNNPVQAGALPDLIAAVHASLSGINKPADPPALAQVPAVNPKRSVFPDHIVCLEDGKKFRTLRKHLWSEHDITPDEYRRKWNLPAGYPMIAPDYSATRSALAKAAGLGKAAPAKKASVKRNGKA
jgi:predicted transcriptional regulator